MFNVKFAVHLLGTVALFAIAESGVAQAACSISKSTNDYVCDTTQPAAASSGASSTSKNPSSAAVGGGEPIFMPTPSPSGGSYTPRVAKSFTFNGTSGGTMIREGTPNKIMGISSSIHGETASLVTTAMGLNIDPTVTIIDSSGRVVYSYTAVESTMVRIIFSDTGTMPDNVSNLTRLTYIPLKTNETYYYVGSVTAAGGSSPTWFRMEVYD